VLKWLRVVGVSFLDALAAVIGTSVIAQEFHFHPSTLLGMMVLSEIRSAIIALALGFVVYYVWRTKSSRWVWVLGLVWFVYGAVAYWNSQHYLRIVRSSHSIFWDMSGIGAARNRDIRSVDDFLVYTIPLIRTACYSIGAFSCSYLFQRGWTGWSILSKIRARSSPMDEEPANE